MGIPRRALLIDVEAAVLELVMEADVVHLLEDLELSRVGSNHTVTAAAQEFHAAMFPPLAPAGAHYGRRAQFS